MTRESPRELLKACAENDAPRARRELSAWIRGQATDQSTDQSTEQSTEQSPGEWLRAEASEDLRRAVAALDGVLYGPDTDGPDWDGQALANAVKGHGDQKDAPTQNDALPPLYLGS